jgi:hypothetical protein
VALLADRLKELLTRAGARCSRRTLHRLGAVVNYLEVGRWLAEFGADTSRRFPDRLRLYDFVIGRIGPRAVLYLEFGVYRGESLRYWSGKLEHPESTLVGFDSFLGLPADFNLTLPRGTFSTDGEPPVFADPRVRLVKGLFEETLPRFVPERGKVVVIHLDADLHSSTSFVLRTLQDAIVPGSYLLFDEFSDRGHEMRAFDEFLAESGQRYEFLAGDRTLARVAFQRRA